MSGDNRIPVNGQDIFNHLVGRFASNHQINFVVEFDGRLDETALAQAVRMTVESETVLGCRLVEEPGRLFWERREDLDQAGFFSLVQPEDTTEELRRFITSPMDSFSDPLVQVRLFRSPRDTLCVKINHDCCDAGGLKEYLRLLSTRYSSRCSDPGHQLNRKKGCDRSQAGVFSSLNITDPVAAFDQSQINGPSTWAFPFASLETQGPDFVVRRLGRDDFAKAFSNARQHGATINDLLVTGFYRSLFDLNHTPILTPMGMQVTVDLRRYLPGGRANAVCNLSGSLNVYLSRVENEGYTETLRRVSREMGNAKMNTPGVQTGFFFEVLDQLGFPWAEEMFRQSRRVQVESGHTNPMLSNLGVISDEVCFGELKAVKAYIVTPVTMSPNFLLGASTYDGELTLTAGFYRESVEKTLVESCLDNILYQICSKLNRSK